MPVLNPGYIPTIPELELKFLIAIGEPIHAEIPPGADLPPGSTLVEIIPPLEYSAVPDPTIESAGFEVFMFGEVEEDAPIPPPPVVVSQSRGALLDYYYYETFRRNARRRRNQ